MTSANFISSPKYDLRTSANLLVSQPYPHFFAVPKTSSFSLKKSCFRSWRDFLAIKSQNTIIYTARFELHQLHTIDKSQSNDPSSRGADNPIKELNYLLSSQLFNVNEHFYQNESFEPSAIKAKDSLSIMDTQLQRCLSQRKSSPARWLGWGSP